MNRILIAVGIILLGGCAPFAPLEKGLTNLQGKHISEAISVIGSHPEKRDCDCGKMYIWSTDRNTASVIQVPASAPGGMIFLPIPIPVHYECHIEILTDNFGYIDDWRFNGNVGGCTPWIKRFKEYNAYNPE